MQALLERGIATRRGIMCAHREAAYPKDSWRSAGMLTASEKAQGECILLPFIINWESKSGSSSPTNFEPRSWHGEWLE